MFIRTPVSQYNNMGTRVDVLSTFHAGYLKCVLCLSCLVHGPIYGRFMGFYVKVYIERKPFIQDPRVLVCDSIARRFHDGSRL